MSGPSSGKGARSPVAPGNRHPLKKALEYGPWPDGIVPVSEETRRDIDEFLEPLSAVQSHPYSDRLGIPPLGALWEPYMNRLALPIRNVLGGTTGVQILSMNLEPFYWEGSELIGNGLLLGQLQGARTLGICVDWPSGVAVHLMNDIPVLVVFEHRNLEAAVDVYRRLPLDILLFGERGDAHAQIKFLKVAAKFGCTVLLPDPGQLNFHDRYIDKKFPPRF